MSGSVFVPLAQVPMPESQQEGHGVRAGTEEAGGGRVWADPLHTISSSTKWGLWLCFNGDARGPMIILLALIYTPYSGQVGAVHAILSTPGHVAGASHSLSSSEERALG